MDEIDNKESDEYVAQPVEQEKKAESADEDTPLTSAEGGRAKTKERTSQKKKSLKEKLLDSLGEEEIKELLAAKEELEDKNKLLEEKSDLLLEYEDLLKRKQAEFENYKKRAQREFDENKKYATTELLLDIINTIDNLERASDSAQSSKDFDALLEGIVIVENQFKSLLEKKYGVVVIDDVGKEFDPNIHDAIMMEESDEYEDDTVIENFQKGYRLYERIIRPAKVKVAKAVSPFSEEEDEEDGSTASSEKGV
jgi:molecular chaperone GrpE